MLKHSFSRSSLTRIIAVGILLFARCSLFSQVPDSDWNSLEMAARTYFSYPSTENARLLYLGLQRPIRMNTDRVNMILDYVFNNLTILVREISQGDRNAVKLGFCLYDYSSGLFTMRLDAAMADSIRSHPQLFLEELRASPNLKRIKTLGYPLCESFLNFNDDRGAAHRYELVMRILALESVTDDELVDLRDACLVELRNCLDRQYHDYQGIILKEKEYLALFKKAITNIYREAEMANQVCGRVIEMNEASNAGAFDATSNNAVRSSGLSAELTALSVGSLDMGKALENPPLAYMKAYDAFKSMVAKASQLFNLALNPSIICPSGTSDEVKKSAFKRATKDYYHEFKKRHAELVSLLADVW